MKTLVTLFVPLLFPLILLGQQFQWATSYNIESANEVSAIVADADSNLIAVGIFKAPTTMPYNPDYSSREKLRDSISKIT